VGNLTVGGTGKTPCVILLARMLAEAGHTVAVLSRGYARKKGTAVQLVADGQRVLAPLEEAGDEPLMMAKKIPGVWIWIGRARYRAGLAAWERARPSIYLLDDGFQHRQLHRDLNVVVTAAPRPFGNGLLIPAGPLRESPLALERADLVILTEIGEDREGREAQEAIQRIPHAPRVLRARYRPRGLWSVERETRFSPELLAGTQVALICGIGRPLGLRMVTEGLGARVAECLFFPDHYWYTHKDFDGFRHLAGKVDWLVTTEKDAWKLREIGGGIENLLALEVELEFAEPDELRGVLSPFL
jgi:tetraacyldisaccharide 4'-kinase